MKRSSGRSGTLVIVVLSAAAAVAALVWLGTRPPRADPASGSIHQPPAPVDSARIAQSYLPGREYRSIVVATLSGKASNKDWGVVADMNFHYRAEMEIRRKIEKNDGSTIVLVQEYPTARTMALYTTFEGFHFDLGPTATLILGGIELLGTTQAELPPGWATASMKAIEGLGNNVLVKNALGVLADDKAGKIFRFVDGIEGKKVRITYVNGRGVTAVEPMGCTLSDREKVFIEASSIASDTYILPDLQSTEGQTWDVRAEDLMSVMDPSLAISTAGTLTVKRGRYGGSAGDKTATIMVDKGTVDLQQWNDKSVVVGKWAPRGKMEFSFKDRIVTSAELDGGILLEKRSTRHILFESRFSAQPQYRITYTCQVR